MQRILKIINTCDSLASKLMNEKETLLQQKQPDPKMTFLLKVLENPMLRDHLTALLNTKQPITAGHQFSPSEQLLELKNENNNGEKKIELAAEPANSTPKIESGIAIEMENSKLFQEMKMQLEIKTKGLWELSLHTSEVTIEISDHLRNIGQGISYKSALQPFLHRRKKNWTIEGVDAIFSELDFRLVEISRQIKKLQHRQQDAVQEVQERKEEKTENAIQLFIRPPGRNETRIKVHLFNPNENTELDRESFEQLQEKMEQMESNFKKQAQVHKEEKERLQQEIERLKQDTKKDENNGLLKKIPVNFESTFAQTDEELPIKLKQPKETKKRITEKIREDQKATIIPEKTKNVAQKGPQVKNLLWLLRLISNVYMGKIQHDKANNAVEQTAIPPADYILEYLKQIYGTQRLVEEYAASVQLSVEKYRKQDQRVAQFSRLMQKDADRKMCQLFFTLWAYVEESKVGPEYHGRQFDDLPKPAVISKVRCLYALNSIKDEIDDILDSILEELDKVFEVVTEQEYAKALSLAGFKGKGSNAVDTMEQWGVDEFTARCTITKTAFFELICAIVQKRNADMKQLLPAEPINSGTTLSNKDDSLASHGVIPPANIERDSMQANSKYTLRDTAETRDTESAAENLI